MTLSRKLATLIVQKNVNIDDVADTLRTYNLLSLLPSILKDVKQMGEEGSVHDTVLIESPFELGDAAIARIKRIIGNDIAPHEVTINKNILAGFKARFKGKLYDGSAERIIKQFTNNQ